jgi:hypothetical protein
MGEVWIINNFKFKKSFFEFLFNSSLNLNAASLAILEITKLKINFEYASLALKPLFINGTFVLFIAAGR